MMRLRANYVCIRNGVALLLQSLGLFWEIVSLQKFLSIFVNFYVHPTSIKIGLTIIRKSQNLRGEGGTVENMGYFNVIWKKKYFFNTSNYWQYKQSPIFVYIQSSLMKITFLS